MNKRQQDILAARERIRGSALARSGSARDLGDRMDAKTQAMMDETARKSRERFDDTLTQEGCHAHIVEQMKELFPEVDPSQSVKSPLGSLLCHLDEGIMVRTSPTQKIYMSNGKDWTWGHEHVLLIGGTGFQHQDPRKCVNMGDVPEEWGTAILKALPKSIRAEGEEQPLPPITEEDGVPYTPPPMSEAEEIEEHAQLMLEADMADGRFVFELSESEVDALFWDCEGREDRLSKLRALGVEGEMDTPMVKVFLDLISAFVMRKEAADKLEAEGDA